MDEASTQEFTLDVAPAPVEVTSREQAGDIIAKVEKAQFRNFMAQLISSFDVWDNMPEGRPFWKDIYVKLDPTAEEGFTDWVEFGPEWDALVSFVQAQPKDQQRAVIADLVMNRPWHDTVEGPDFWCDVYVDIADGPKTAPEEDDEGGADEEDNPAPVLAVQ